MVHDGETGILVERGNSAALAEALDLILEDKGKRERMGLNARELVLDKFSFEKNAASYLRLYQAIIGP